MGDRLGTPGAVGFIRQRRRSLQLVTVSVNIYNIIEYMAKSVHLSYDNWIIVCVCVCVCVCACGCLCVCGCILVSRFGFYGKIDVVLKKKVS